jgi:hypothetical protein
MNEPRSWGFNAALLAAAFVAMTAGAHEPGKSDVSADATGAIESFSVNGHTELLQSAIRDESD